MKYKMKYNYEVSGEMCVEAESLADFNAKTEEILKKAERNICRAFNEQCITGKVRVLSRD